MRYISEIFIRKYSNEDSVSFAAVKRYKHITHPAANGPTKKAGRTKAGKWLGK